MLAGVSPSLPTQSGLSDPVEVNRVFRDGLAPAATYLALGFPVMVASHLLSMPIAQAWPSMTSALVWIALLLGWRWHLREHTLPLAWAGPAGLSMVGMVAVSLSPGDGRQR